MSRIMYRGITVNVHAPHIEADAPDDLPRYRGSILLPHVTEVLKSHLEHLSYRGVHWQQMVSLLPVS